MLNHYLGVKRAAERILDDGIVLSRVYPISQRKPFPLGEG